MEVESKNSIRRRMWDYMEKEDIADFPRPVYNRIPNFKGAAAACNRLQSMDVFRRASVVKVNPDKPQQQARFLTLEAHKTLLVPTPRLRKGLFNRIVPPSGAKKATLRTCSTSQGVRQYSTAIGLDALVNVDLVIIGSVAVSPDGYRIGKGEGYADMEFAMMSSMGAINDATVVVTTVHDCQVLDSIPEGLLGEHDLGVDIILTPTRTISCGNRRKRPAGILWNLLSREKFSEIPILGVLRDRERKAGKDVRLRDEREIGKDVRLREETKTGKDVRLREETGMDQIRQVPLGAKTRDQTFQPCAQTGTRGQMSCGAEKERSAGQPSIDSKKEAQDQKSHGASNSDHKHSPANKMATDNRTSSFHGNPKKSNPRSIREVDKDRAAEERSFDLQKGPQGQRSRGSSNPRPPSSRRKDLGNMFAWSK